MSVSNYEELKAHIGHDISCVFYGSKKSPENIAIECEDCSEVLLDFDKPEPKKKGRRKKPTEPFEIQFDDLNEDAQERYLEFTGAKSSNDFNFEPLAIIEIPEED